MFMSLCIQLVCCLLFQQASLLQTAVNLGDEYLASASVNHSGGQSLYMSSFSDAEHVDLSSIVLYNSS